MKQHHIITLKGGMCSLSEHENSTEPFLISYSNKNIAVMLHFSEEDMKALFNGMKKLQLFKKNQEPIIEA